MIPKLVVPLVATTAKNVSGPCSSSTSRRRSPVRRQFSSTWTPTISASMTWQAESIEECAACVAATRHGRAPAPARPSCRALARAVSRAATRADRFPMVPPGTKTPPAAEGRPARSAIQRSAWFSVDGAGALEPRAP